ARWPHCPAGPWPSRRWLARGDRAQRAVLVKIRRRARMVRPAPMAPKEEAAMGPRAHREHRARTMLVPVVVQVLTRAPAQALVLGLVLVGVLRARVLVLVVVLRARVLVLVVVLRRQVPRRVRRALPQAPLWRLEARRHRRPRMPLSRRPEMRPGKVMIRM